jgi:serine/threonine protein kinase/Flp pilus assembly protein TadD
LSDLLERVQAALTDRYRVVSEIGRGGMATVFRADDLRHDRVVAVKVLQPEFTASAGADRFLREIEIATGLSHPFIVPIFDSGAVDGLLYYVMSFFEGESLRDRLDREKQLPVEEALRVAEQVADALEYAHGQGIVHRDIKPANILFCADHALVADFGIAKAVTAAGADKLTQTGFAVGTPAYMSPEQAGGETNVDGRSDLYALGCVLYEMLAGDPPFTGATAQVIFARKSTESVPSLTTARETVSGGVEAVISKALSKAPADRFRTAREFSDALKSAESWSAFEPKPPMRRKLLKGIGAIGLIATLFLAISAIRNSSQDRPDGESASAPTPSEIMQSRQMYLRAEAEWENARRDRDRERYLTAVAMLDSAVAMDSSNAKAWAALASHYAFFGVQRILPSDSVFPLVMDPARTAMELDSTLALAHEALALKYWIFDWEWIRAHDEFVRAAQLEPDTPDAARRLAEASHILTDLGRGDSAVAIVRPVVGDHPLAAHNYLIALLNNGRFEQAISEARKLDSADIPAGWRWMFGAIRVKALLELGRYSEAEDELPGMDSLVSDIPPLRGEQRMLEWYVQARSGNTAAAEAVLAEASESGLSPVSQAILYAWLGNTDRALDLLEAEFEAKGFVFWFPSSPDFGPLREDRRYADLLYQMGLSCQYGVDGHKCYQR